jgi:alkylation response protein AidB-like acyl-CoA dehydrogenase
MDFHLTPHEEAFRHEVWSWLKENMPEGWPDPTPYTNERKRTACLKAWQRKLGAAKLAGIAWPQDYGGREAALAECWLGPGGLADARRPG